MDETLTRREFVRSPIHRQPIRQRRSRAIGCLSSTYEGHKNNLIVNDLIRTQASAQCRMNEYAATLEVNFTVQLRLEGGPGWLVM
jgi:hypothetical protein